MQTNATVTIKRRGDSYSQTTGRRGSTTQETVISAVPCVFSQPRGGSRQRYQNGQRDLTNAIYSVLIPQTGRTDLASIEIAPGDQATVAITRGKHTISQSFSVVDAIPAPGIAEFHWEVTVERNKHAKP